MEISPDADKIKAVYAEYRQKVSEAVERYNSGEWDWTTFFDAMRDLIMEWDNLGFNRAYEDERES